LYPEQTKLKRTASAYSSGENQFGITNLSYARSGLKAPPKIAGQVIAGTSRADGVEF